ncbi:MAG: NADH-quinone oxidoreductase subunit J [Alphaproteobacteria bacterium]
MLATLLFYFFSGLLLVSSACVILVRETVHSVFFLILAFINAAGLFVLAGAEFLAMLLIVVYVGAVAVLFLFVVMMLGVDFKKLRATSSSPYRVVGGIVGGLLCLELVVAMVGWVAFPESFHLSSLPMSTASSSNAHQLGYVLYTTYFLPFQISGFILLVAMIGAIALTLRLREDVKRQSIKAQISQKGKESVTLVDVPIGKGV